MAWNEAMKTWSILHEINDFTVALASKLDCSKQASLIQSTIGGRRVCEGEGTTAI